MPYKHYSDAKRKERRWEAKTKKNQDQDRQNKIKDSRKGFPKRSYHNQQCSHVIALWLMESHSPQMFTHHGAGITFLQRLLTYTTSIYGIFLVNTTLFQADQAFSNSNTDFSPVKGFCTPSICVNCPNWNNKQLYWYLKHSRCFIKIQSNICPVLHSLFIYRFL